MKRVINYTNINFLKFVRRMLPRHWRLPNRLAFFQAPAKEINYLYSIFLKYRLVTSMLAGSSGQLLALRHLIVRYFDYIGVSVGLDEIRIIEDFTDTVVYIGRSDETGEDYKVAGIESEGETYLILPEIGSIASAVDYKVVVPSYIYDNERYRKIVRDIIEKYRQAGRSFIIQSN